MHIHGLGHCDIRLPLFQQQRVLAEGQARPHRWAPEKGYVSAFVTNRETFRVASGLIQISHQHFLAARNTLPKEMSAEMGEPNDA